ncbi:MAG: lipoyl(octanoyl) transferase LipB [SAR202 cluster bacterium]|nr:lipoyl(octanoyl) transferase LipB [SAR202 cluster bacterium]
MDLCHVAHLGLIEYHHAWDLQKHLVDQVSRAQRPNTLLLLQHPHVYTLGRRGQRQDILLDEARLQTLGVQVVESDRGGQVTYHGPGQLVAYPIVNLRDWGGPLKYVRTLEQVMISTLADYGLQATLIPGLTGVWVKDAKIGAIGVKISRGVAHHGLALNVSPDLSYFQHIIPCGITDKSVASMQALLGKPVSLEDVAYTLQFHFGRLMSLRMLEIDPIKEGLQPQSASRS